MDNNIEQLLAEYQERRPLFEEFNLAVLKLLQIMLDEGGYKYHISYRTKAIDSLKEKLARKESEGKVFERLEDIKDLAGVRIIFYFESDKKRFSRKMNREISGQLILEKKNKPSGYTAEHIIVSFGPKRLILNEYKKFENLKCEVQLTSILYHAWSEIEHDLIYKNINKNQKKFKNIKNHLNKVLKNNIQKAVTNIEKIAKLLKK